MPHDIGRLRGLKVVARDGEIGQLEDVYFEDDSWIIRYLVVDTGGWLTGRTVLLSPHAVRSVDAQAGLAVDLTRDQVRESPDFDTAKPVSRQFETSLYGHYGYPYYWRGPYFWGIAPYPYPGDMPEAPQGTASREVEEMKAARREEDDPHLRSAVEVAGYYVEARDGDIGHVETFLVDERSWRITAIVVDTKNWWPGKHVVIQPSAVDSIDWPEHKVYVAASRDSVRSAPEYGASPAGAA